MFKSILLSITGVLLLNVCSYATKDISTYTSEREPNNYQEKTINSQQEKPK